MFEYLLSRSAIRYITVALCLLLPQTLMAYHYSAKWATVPIALIADSDTGFAAKVQSAILPWNQVSTAKDVFSGVTTSTVNFTGANFMKTGGWGDPKDGKVEIVCDADGTVFAEFGDAVEGATGFAQTEVSGGIISDAYFVLDCVASRSTSDQVGTMIHELGHVLGLDHSSVYQQLDEAIDPVATSELPTMHWQFASGRNTLEADDVAGISELYPDTTFATALGSIEGTVTRCGTGEAVLGVNVRAVSTSTRRVQVTRYSGYDGNTEGRYRINGLPPGSYRIVIEVLSFPRRPADYPLDVLTRVKTRIDSDFAAEYYNAPAEDDCTEELPDTAVTVALSGGTTETAKHFKTNPIELAFVVDDTGSMFEEIAGVRATLTNQISRLKAITTKPFPNTAIVTFKDNVTVRKVSRDPVVLQSIVDSLSASGGGDCPEHSNDAMLAAGKMLRKGGTAMLFTDADSHPDGATSVLVSSFYVAKNLTFSSLLSGTCSGSGFSSVPLEETDGAALMDPASSDNRDPSTTNRPFDELPAGPTLGVQSAIETYSSIAGATGGLFVAIPGVNFSEVESERYVNVGTNIAVSATLPTVSLLLPGDGPAGSTIDVDITGTNTSFQSGSTVSFSGTGVTVNSIAVKSAKSISANITVAASAALGFRDVTVTTVRGSDSEVATGVGAFNVVAASTSPTIVSVVPASGSRGRSVTVTIRAANASFAAGSTPLFCTSFCFDATGADPRITVNSTMVVDANTLIANVTIAADATISYRNVAVVTGGELATESVVGPFLIGAAPLAIPQLTSVSPAMVTQGQTVTLSVTGENTNFVSGTSVAGVGGIGVTVNGTTVVSPTAATVSITVGASAAAGFRDVSMTTGAEVAVLLSGLTIVDPPQVTSQPSNQTVTAGGNVQFTVQAAGGSLSYQWQVSTDGGGSWSDLSDTAPYAGATTAVLTLTGVTAGMNGNRYRCVVANVVSVTSNSARLVLNAVIATPSRVNIGAIRSGSTWQHTTPAQEVTLTFPGVTSAWTAAADQPWVSITNGSGSGDGTFVVAVDGAAVSAGATNLTATITITAASIGLTATVPVSLTVKSAGDTSIPIGLLDTPSEGAALSGSFAVTGWALDDVGIDRVEIWRDRVAGETTPVYSGGGPGNGKIFIANGFFVPGARPDVEQAYGSMPQAARAGWGYLLLSYGLWNQGNGTFTIHAFAYDVEGRVGNLGAKTIAVNNATAVKPFGSIDTPTYGQTVSGAFFNFGWALTPNATPTCVITNGNVQMSIDSGPLVPVSYGDARPDIAAAFPGFSNGSGAGGAFLLDTTTLSNGTHQIGWYVVDSCNRAEGIGSRFFTVLNGSSSVSADERAGASTRDVMPSAEPITVRRTREQELVLPGSQADRVVTVAQGERIEVQLPSNPRPYTGVSIVNGARRPLPLGSSLDASTGTFYWEPGPGFLGAQDLEFTAGDQGPVWVRVIVGTSVQAVIDTPRPGDVSSSFVIAGWAIDQAATTGTGIDTVHVWAYPSAGGEPIFLGVARYGDRREDIASTFGEPFASSAYSLAVAGLAPGIYDVVVYPRSVVTGDFGGAKVIRVTTR